MRCPFCEHSDSKVLDSRPVDEGRSIRRRRECLSCGKRFTTYEKIEEIPIIVVKNDNRREQFDGNKIMRGLLKACDKRKIPTEVLEGLVHDIEHELGNSVDREVHSHEIGEMVMERLRQIDEVAYVRFASVYRQFADPQDFIDALNQLKQHQPGSRK